MVYLHVNFDIENISNDYIQRACFKNPLVAFL